LVEVEKVSLKEMQMWKLNYPEAFKREYDPAFGLQFNAWIESRKDEKDVCNLAFQPPFYCIAGINII
jgi:hypothetical protein